jgi:hypothetical protein
LGLGQAEDVGKLRASGETTHQIEPTKKWIWPAFFVDLIGHLMMFYISAIFEAVKL